MAVEDAHARASLFEFGYLAHVLKGRIYAGGGFWQRGPELYSAELACVFGGGFLGVGDARAGRHYTDIAAA